MTEPAADSYQRASAPIVTVDDWTSGNGEVCGRWRVTGTDAYQPGHYPGNPVVPGVFVIESAFQLVAAHSALVDGRLLVLARIVSARFVSPVRIGDTLVFRASCQYLGALVTANVTAAEADGRPVARLQLEARVAGDGHIAAGTPVASEAHRASA